MKKLLTFLLAAAFVAPAVFADTFEGKVSMKMTDPKGGSIPTVYTVKGNRARMEVQMQGMTTSMIMDMDKREVTMLMPGQPMYMVMPIPDEAVGAVDKAGAPTLEKTGEKEKILGYDAEKYLTRSKDGITEMWVTDELGRYFSAPNPGAGRKRGGSTNAWEKMLADKGLFPLRIVGKNNDNKETFRLEVTAIEKQSVPDSTFAPPDGYQKFDMGNMMKGMGK